MPSRKRILTLNGSQGDDKVGARIANTWGPRFNAVGTSKVVNFICMQENTEERKDLSMQDRRSSPHYQRKRANISYQGRNTVSYRRTDTRKTLFCVRVLKPLKGSVELLLLLSASDRGVEGLSLSLQAHVRIVTQTAVGIFKSLEEREYLV